MGKVICIDTGGTFNKIYNLSKGELEVDCNSLGAKKIFESWLCSFELIPIIGKDSLNFTQNDRELLVKTIASTPKNTKIIIIHGTDTIDISAAYVAKSDLARTIVFTGAMSPFSIEPIESAANLASAIGFATAQDKSGVYICINGLFGSYDEVKKNRELARFFKIK